MSSFTYINHSIVPPPGSIMPYIGSGTTSGGTNPGDPDGWVICDGEPRIVSDNRFVNVFSLLNTYLSTSSNTSNTITPPNLTGQFIYGNASTATDVMDSGGSSTVTLTTDTLPAHSHTVNDSGHYHKTIGNGDAEMRNNIYDNGASGSGIDYWGGSGSGSSVAETSTSTTGITLDSSGNGNAFSILPPYTTMNYIMKY